jgi:hypothetical protein
LKEEALDRTLWRTRFERGYGPVVRPTTLWRLYTKASCIYAPVSSETRLTFIAAKNMSYKIGTE